MTNLEIFNNIYLESSWGYKSGPGSDPDFAKPWIEVVNSFLAKDDIVKIIDVGCGDWRIGKHLNLEGKDYTGVEVSSVMFKETALNSSTNIRFIQADFETLDIPNVDIIIIKDVLQHLPNNSVYNIVNKIMEKSRYALFCDDIAVKNNNSILPGEHRYLDLSKDPFNFNFKRIESFGQKAVFLYVKPV